jgi:hypothetical protein
MLACWQHSEHIGMGTLQPCTAQLWLAVVVNVGGVWQCLAGGGRARMRDRRPPGQLSQPMAAGAVHCSALRPPAQATGDQCRNHVMPCQTDHAVMRQQVSASVGGQLLTATELNRKDTSCQPSAVVAASVAPCPCTSRRPTRLAAALSQHPLRGPCGSPAGQLPQHLRSSTRSTGRPPGKCEDHLPSGQEGQAACWCGWSAGPSEQTAQNALSPKDAATCSSLHRYVVCK